MNIIITQNQSEIRLIHNTGHLYWVKGIHLPKIDSVEYKKLLEKFNQTVLSKKVEVLSDDSSTKEDINTFLNASILSLSYQKTLVKKDLEDYEHIRDTDFSYLAISNFSKDIVLSNFTKIVNNDESMCSKSIQKLEELMAMTENDSYKQDWKMVKYKNELIGMILPFKYLDDLNEGTLLYIGMLPEYRNKGYAKEIHRSGLQFLKEMGVESYFGSTLITNTPMLKVFEQNDCEVDVIQLFYK